MGIHGTEAVVVCIVYDTCRGNERMGWRCKAMQVIDINQIVALRYFQIANYPCSAVVITIL